MIILVYYILPSSLLYFKVIQSFFFSFAVWPTERTRIYVITNEGHPAYSHIDRLLFLHLYTINTKTKQHSALFNLITQLFTHHAQIDQSLTLHTYTHHLIREKD